MANLNASVNDNQSINNNSFLTIQPPAGQEYMIVNIQVPGAAELYKSDGTNDVLFDNVTLKGGWANYKWFITNSHYLKVKNVSGSAMRICYDGVRII